MEALMCLFVACLLVLPASAEQCKCEPDMHYHVIECRGCSRSDLQKQLHNVQQVLKDFVRVLDLSNNNIIEVRNIDFSGYRNSMRVDLSNNNIQNIDEHVFENNTKLTRLVLNNNPWLCLPPGMRSNSITHLFLDGSALEKLKVKQLAHLTRLAHLYLRGHDVSECATLKETLKYTIYCDSDGNNETFMASNTPPLNPYIPNTKNTTFTRNTTNISTSEASMAFCTQYMLHTDTKCLTSSDMWTIMLCTAFLLITIMTVIALCLLYWYHKKSRPPLRANEMPLLSAADKPAEEANRSSIHSPASVTFLSNICCDNQEKVLEDKGLSVN